MLTLTADGTVTAGGLELGPVGLRLDYDVEKWDDVTGYLADHPEKIITQLGDAIWKTVKDCAMKTASEAM